MPKLDAPCKNPQPYTSVSFNDQHQTRCLRCDFLLIPANRPDGTAGWKHLADTPIPPTPAK